MKIIESTIITKEQQLENDKTNIIKSNAQSITDLSKKLQKSDGKIDKINEESKNILHSIEKLSEVSRGVLENSTESSEKVNNLLSDELRNTSKIDETLNKKLTDVENKLTELKSEYSTLSKKQVSALQKNNVDKELASIDIKISEMVDLLKKIKDKKQQTTVVGGGGGGTYIPLKNGSVTSVNPDGSYIGNTLGIPKHNNGSVSYPDATTDVFVFKQDATTVATVTIGYTDGTKSLMSSWSIT